MATPKAGERVALYARISQDDTGFGAGVSRQLADTSALAEQRGWQVAHQLVDNDVSAYSGAHRPGYLALMQLVDERQVDRVVVYQTSRLWRSRRERAADMERLREARVSVAAVRGPELDLSTASGRMLAGILGEFDTAESEIKGERVARAAAQRAVEGRANGAALYGWRRVYDHDDSGRRIGFHDEVDPERADVVRRVVKAVAAGETLASIARTLTDEGVPSPGANHRRGRRAPENPDGSAWGPSSVRKIATRAANIGLRVSGRKVIGPAAWPAIVDEVDHAAAVAALSQPGRRTSHDQHVRRHLLTYGIGECGVCGARLRVAPRGGHALYVCEPRQCVGRRQSSVDDLVDRVVVEYVARHRGFPAPTGYGPGGDETSDARDAERLRQKLLDAATMFTADRITAEQMDQITSTLRTQLAEVEARLGPTRVIPDAVRRLVEADDVAAGWAVASLDVRRQTLIALGLRVRIMPTRRGPGFEPADVVFEWGQG